MEPKNISTYKRRQLNRKIDALNMEIKYMREENTKLMAQVNEEVKRKNVVIRRIKYIIYKKDNQGKTQYRENN